MHARKFKFYLKSVILDLFPSLIFEKKYDRMFRNLDEQQWTYIRARANYYNKLERRFILDEPASPSGALPLRRNPSFYYYHLKYLPPYFSPSFQFNHHFHDLNH